MTLEAAEVQKMTDALADELRSYLALKFMGNCKCGHCQLVPAEVIERTALTLDAMKAELSEAKELNHNFATWGVIEVAIRNPSVSDYMKHWEARAEASDSSRDEALRKLEQAREEIERLRNPSLVLGDQRKGVSVDER